MSDQDVVRCVWRLGQAQYGSGSNKRDSKGCTIEAITSSGDHGERCVAICATNVHGRKGAGEIEIPMEYIHEFAGALLDIYLEETTTCREPIELIPEH